MERTGRRMIKIPINVFSSCQRAVTGLFLKKSASEVLKVTFQLLRVVVEVNAPTLRLLKLHSYKDSNLETSDYKSDALSIKLQGRWKKS